MSPREKNVCIENRGMWCPVHGEQCPTTYEFTTEELADMAAWRQRIEEFAARDPEGYMRACAEERPI
jgi:hypothetical protein